MDLSKAHSLKKLNTTCIGEDGVSVCLKQSYLKITIFQMAGLVSISKIEVKNRSESTISGKGQSPNKCSSKTFRRKFLYLGNGDREDEWL